MECSKKLADKAFFLLDADAFLVDRIDEIFEEDPDVILPMVEPAKQGWDYNNCHGLATGLISGLSADGTPPLPGKP